MTRAKAPTTKEGSRAKRADREERNARFARLTHDELRGLADDECAEAVAIRLQAAQDAKNVPAAVRHARAAMRLDSDMRSGGFDQFFRSARPEEVPAALEGLVALGAMEAADVLRRAIALARKKHAPASRASNAPAGRPRDPDLDALDREYFAALPAGTPGRSFEARLAEHVRAHTNGF